MSCRPEQIQVLPFLPGPPGTCPLCWHLCLSCLHPPCASLSLRALSLPLVIVAPFLAPFQPGILGCFGSSSSRVVAGTFPTVPGCSQPHPAWPGGSWGCVTPGAEQGNDGPVLVCELGVSQV